MTEHIGEHFILCLRCKQKIPLPDFPITMQGSVRYEIKNERLSLYAKCNNANCGYENLYSVIDLLNGKSREES